METVKTRWAYHSDYAEAAMIDRDRLLATLKCMETYGGGFCQALAEAWYRADAGNGRKLAEAFPNLLADYAPEKWAR